MDIETINGHKISFDKGELSIDLDIWGEAEYTLSNEFTTELAILWNTYQAKPIGTPQRSRFKTSMGIGENAMTPTTVHAEFLCQKDMDDFEEHIRKGLKKKESFQSYKELRAEREKQDAEEKEQRKLALNK